MSKHKHQWPMTEPCVACRTPRQHEAVGENVALGSRYPSAHEVAFHELAGWMDVAPFPHLARDLPSFVSVDDGLCADHMYNLVRLSLPAPTPHNILRIMCNLTIGSPILVPLRLLSLQDHHDAPGEMILLFGNRADHHCCTNHPPPTSPRIPERGVRCSAERSLCRWTMKARPPLPPLRPAPPSRSSLRRAFSHPPADCLAPGTMKRAHYLSPLGFWAGAALLVVACAAPGTSGATGVAPNVLWLPLGDSITWGCTGPTIQDCHSDSGGYRVPLAFALSQAPLGPPSQPGMNLTTMGTLSTGPPTVPSQWQRHEGHPGWQINTVDQILNKSLATSPKAPDLITIHLGTNDCNAKTSTDDMVARMNLLLSHIQAGAPRSQVYLASVISTGNPWDDCIQEFNKRVPSIVALWSKAGLSVM